MPISRLPYEYKITKSSFMSKVKKHLFAADNSVVIYRNSDQTEILGKIRKDEWMGQMDETENHYLIITPQYFGWVKKSSCYQKTNQVLKVNFDRDQPFYYAAS